MAQQSAPIKHHTSASTYVEILLWFFSWTFVHGNFSCLANETVECLAGTYSSAGRSECRPCPKGAYCPNKGLSTFFICANGTYSDVEGRSDCKPCDAGYRCPSVGLEAQEECPNGTYSNSTGAHYCILCPEGHRWEVTMFGSLSSMRSFIHWFTVKWIIIQIICPHYLFATPYEVFVLVL